VFSGAENDIAITARIHGEIPNTIDLAGETNIQELVCLVGISRAIICNDSSVLHIGIAQNRPTIGIFGPTSLRSRVPEIQIPNSIQSSEKCSPCNHYGKFLGCKENGKCMNAITPEIVFRKVKDILNIFK
jgi:heptosyltransferase-2